MSMVILPNDLSIITSAYTNSLTEYPLLTKSVTGFFLCGIGDVLAQSRTTSDTPQEQFDWKRLLRFSSKGAFGTIIWVQWYNLSDVFVNTLPLMNNVSSDGINDPNIMTVAAILRTILLISMEQFIACPIAYGLWEIPVATMLNGAPVSEIKYEVKSKLGRMLIENAKIWTFANIIIYNVPVQFRAALGNLMDILWQSIVSDFAADCGTATTEECPIDEDDKMTMTDEVVQMSETFGLSITSTGSSTITSSNKDEINNNAPGEKIIT